MAARRGFDPLSSVRQTDCHASGITGLDCVSLVCMGRLERPLNALSTQSLCHWGTCTNWWTTMVTIHVLSA